MAPLKNTGLFLLAAFCISLFMGCAEGNDGSEGKNSDAEKVAAAKKALTIPAETDCDLDLPVVLNGVAISWASSDEGVISNDGLITRKQYGAQVTLTATLAFGKAVAVKEFTVTVPDFFKNIDDAIKVHNAKDALKIPTETDIDLYLPVNRGDVTVSWVSSDETVISNDGVVTRQLYDVQAVLTATLTFGSETDTKEFTVTVLAVVEEEADLVELAFQNFPLSVNLRHRVTMIYSDENAVFYCKADNGVLRANSTSLFPLNNITKNVSVLPGEYFYWHDTEVEDGKILYLVLVDHAFIEIVVKLEETIIGYTVIEVYDGMPPHYVFYADILKSVLFPQIDGEYQNISEEYVNSAIEKIKERRGAAFVEIETDMIEFPIPVFNTAGFSSIPGYPIWLKHSDDAAMFECNIDIGHLSMKTHYQLTEIAKNVIAKPGNYIYWFPEVRIGSEQAFIEIILKIDGNIIGYAAIEANSDNGILSGKLLHSALIPQIDSKYQNVTEEQIKAAIEQVK